MSHAPQVLAFVTVLCLVAFAIQRWRFGKRLYDLLQFKDNVALSGVISNVIPGSASLSRNINPNRTVPDLVRDQLKDQFQVPMQIGVTTVLGGAALFMILSKRYDQESLRWAYGVLGTIVGYWLRR